jgi:subtilisin family serine protease
MATPHVAGVVALMLSKNPSLTPDQVLTYLQGTARAFPGTCSECGLGIVDAAAVVSLTPAPGVTPSAPTNIRSNPPQYSILGGYRILWDATANVTTYQLERDQDTGFTAPNYVLSTVTTPATSQAFTEPRVIRIFYFRVRGCNGSLCGPWSEVISREVDCSSNCP